LAKKQKNLSQPIGSHARKKQKGTPRFHDLPFCRNAKKSAHGSQQIRGSRNKASQNQGRKQGKQSNVRVSSPGGGRAGGFSYQFTSDVEARVLQRTPMARKLKKKEGCESMRGKRGKGGGGGIQDGRQFLGKGGQKFIYNNFGAAGTKARL